MFKRIVCLIFISSLIGCEKEIILPEKNNSNITTAAKHGDAGDGVNQYSSYGSDGGITNPSAPVSGPGTLGTGGPGTTIYYGSNTYLGVYVDVMNAFVPIMDIVNIDNIPCMPDIPYFISGNATGTDVYDAEISFNINNDFDHIDFDVVNIVWEVDGSTSAGEDIVLHGLSEDEVKTVICNIYTTDSRNIYLRTLAFDVHVIYNAPNEIPIGSDGTPINTDSDSSAWWLGAHLIFGNNNNIESGLCGSGEGTFAIIVPFAEP